MVLFNTDYHKLWAFATIIHKKVRDCSYLTTQSLLLCTIDPYKICGLDVLETYDFSYNYKLI